MLDLKNWLDGLISLVFGFGLLAVATWTVLLSVHALFNWASFHEHPRLTALMRRRQLLAIYMAVGLLVDLITMTQTITRISVILAVVLYALCVYVIIPALRWTGKIVPAR